MKKKVNRKIKCLGNLANRHEIKFERSIIYIRELNYKSLSEIPKLSLYGNLMENYNGLRCL